ncbi:MAG TPA: PQQ-binding-like beta-propeller repeat protein [Woeseiaceae bacterium]|nr:PQQ-binding-like beta-propeller repeat protein [Woeseiaceae bacterium]
MPTPARCGGDSRHRRLSGITPTAGGIVFFGDVGGTLYALDSRSGRRLWSTRLDGALGGGVISYVAGGRQRLAVAAGNVSPIWPLPKATGRIVVFGLK